MSVFISFPINNTILLVIFEHFYSRPRHSQPRPMISYVDILPLDFRGHLKGCDKRLSISRFTKSRSTETREYKSFCLDIRFTHMDFCFLILAGDTWVSTTGIRTLGVSSCEGPDTFSFETNSSGVTSSRDRTLAFSLAIWRSFFCLIALHMSSSDTVLAGRSGLPSRSVLSVISVPA